MQLFEQQIRHVARRLLRSAAFMAITLITLAVGSGANTAVFSVVNGVLLKPLSFSEPDRLVAVWLTAPGLDLKELNASPSMYFTFREESRVFQDIGLWRDEGASVTGVAEPERVSSLGHQQVRGMFVLHGLLLTSIGVACGLAGAAALTRLMSSFLFEVSPVDPMTYGTVSAGLITAALLASYLPARRATRIDPADALRTE